MRVDENHRSPDAALELGRWLGLLDCLVGERKRESTHEGYRNFGMGDLAEGDECGSAGVTGLFAQGATATAPFMFVDAHSIRLATDSLAVHRITAL